MRRIFIIKMQFEPGMAIAVEDNIAERNITATNVPIIKENIPYGKK